MRYSCAIRALFFRLFLRYYSCFILALFRCYSGFIPLVIPSAPPAPLLPLLRERPAAGRTRHPGGGFRPSPGDPARGLGPAAKAEPRCGFSSPPMRAFDQGPCGVVGTPGRWSHVHLVPCSPRQALPAGFRWNCLSRYGAWSAVLARWPSSGVHLCSLPRLVRVGVGLSASLAAGHRQFSTNFDLWN